MESIDRKAELLHLSDLRDLEAVKYMLEQKRDEADSNYCDCSRQIKYAENVLSTPIEERAKENRFAGVPSLIGCIALFTVMGIAVGKFFGCAYNFITCGPVESHSGVFMLFLIMFIIGGIIAGGHFFIEAHQDSDRDFNNAIYKYNKSVSEHRECERKLPALRSKRDEALVVFNQTKAEIEVVQGILDKVYSANIIPKNYCYNIHAIFHFYEYISTSNYSLDDAIKDYRQWEMINRLDVIINKMNEIIENQREMIALQRSANAKMDNLIEGNNKMLAKLSSIEKSAERSEQYNRIAAGYAETNAYFSAGTYAQVLSLSR